MEWPRGAAPLTPARATPPPARRRPTWQPGGRRAPVGCRAAHRRRGASARGSWLSARAAAAARPSQTRGVVGPSDSAQAPTGPGGSRGGRGPRVERWREQRAMWTLALPPCALSAGRALRCERWTLPRWRGGSLGGRVGSVGGAYLASAVAIALMHGPFWQHAAASGGASSGASRRPLRGGVDPVRGVWVPTFCSTGQTFCRCCCCYSCCSCWCGGGVVCAVAASTHTLDACRHRPTHFISPPLLAPYCGERSSTPCSDTMAAPVVVEAHRECVGGGAGGGRQSRVISSHPPHARAGRRFNVRVPPMAPLSRVVEEALSQLAIPDPPDPSACKLLLRGRPLDLGTPLRFANVGKDKLELVTGARRWIGGGGASVGGTPTPTRTTPPHCPLLCRPRAGAGRARGPRACSGNSSSRRRAASRGCGE